MGVTGDNVFLRESGRVRVRCRVRETWFKD